MKISQYDDEVFSFNCRTGVKKWKMTSIVVGDGIDCDDSTGSYLKSDNIFHVMIIPMNDIVFSWEFLNHHYNIACNIVVGCDCQCLITFKCT